MTSHDGTKELLRLTSRHQLQPALHSKHLTDVAARRVGFAIPFAYSLRHSRTLGSSNVGII